MNMSILSRLLSLLLPTLFAMIAALHGCGCNMSPTGPLGATVGGAQDIGWARQIIKGGGVPEASAIVAEGLYSEHDIATLPGSCKGKLCLSLGYGYATAVDDGKPALFVQLGMTSTIKPDEFKRSKLQLALVIDKSGSMSGGSMEAVKAALYSLVGKLTPDDEVSLTAFNTEADLFLPMTRVGDGSVLWHAIDRLHADGGTNIEKGLSLGYDQLAKAPQRDGFSKRVMLFTDAMPNHGSTDKESFRGMTARYAAEGIGLTAFGVGVDFGQELTYHITQLRGGNFFFLESADKIRKVFDKEFDYLVTPIAYDLKLKLPTPPGLRLRMVYGLPTWRPGDRDAILDIPTVFLSSNRGAIILRYERDDSASLQLDQGMVLANGTLDYLDPADGLEAQRAELRHAGARLMSGDRFYTHDGARKAVTLTNIYLGLHDGCTYFHASDKARALAIIDAARAAAELENAVLNDAGITTEIALLAKLAENIRSN